MIRYIRARGLENFGGIVDLAYTNVDLKGATVTNFETNEEYEDVEVSITIETTDNEVFVIGLVQRNHNR